ncbi:hypothetical protein [Sphingobacterium thermophilum]
MAQQQGIARKDLNPAAVQQFVKTVEIQEITFPAGTSYILTTPPTKNL